MSSAALGGDLVALPSRSWAPWVFCCS